MVGGEEVSEGKGREEEAKDTSGQQEIRKALGIVMFSKKYDSVTINLNSAQFS